MSFVNVVDSLNRLSLVNNLRHNQNLLIDLITEDNIPPPTIPRRFANMNSPLFSAMQANSQPNINRPEYIRRSIPR